MTIYIATNQAGRGVTNVTQFDNKADLYSYAVDVLSFTDRYPLKRHNVSELCELLADYGSGFGSRCHYRVNRKAALDLIKEPCVCDDTWLKG